MSDISKQLADLDPHARAALVARLKLRRGVAPAPAAAPRQLSYALSSGQERLWFLEQFDRAAALYNLTVTLRFGGRLDLALLGRALDSVIARHDILRSRFEYDHNDETLCQTVQAPFSLALPLVDLRHLGQLAAAEAQRLVRAQDSLPFELDSGPLLRASAVRCGEQETLLVLTMHHIITDGWSYHILLDEVSRFFCAAGAAGGALAAPLQAQYADYVAWEREQLDAPARQAQVQYWQHKLAHLPALINLPLDRPRKAVQTYRGGSAELRLTPALSQRAREFSRARGVTVFMTMLAVFKLLLQKYSGHDDVVVGTPISRRPKAEFEQLMGFFVNTLVLRTEIGGADDFDAIVAKVKETCQQAYSHQDLPFEELVKLLQPERTLSQAPLFQVMFSMSSDPIPAWNVPDLTLELVKTATASAKFDLSLALIDSAGAISGKFEYSSDLFEPDSIARLSAHYLNLLEQVLESPARRAADLAYLSADELSAFVAGRHSALPVYPAATTLRDLVLAQARRTPDAIAVLDAGMQLSYADLVARAAALAHTLRARGVGPEGRVGVCMARSAHMIVSMLAVHLAGGAYVALDPDYPQDRLDYMRADCRMLALLTVRRHADRFGQAALAVVYADDAHAPCSVQQLLADPDFLQAANLSHIIYTSGSTGRPKGVCVTHANSAAMLAWGAQRYGGACLDYVAASTSICFDLSVYEIFLPLCSGGAVCVLTNLLALAADECRHMLTLINTVPSAMALLLEQQVRLPALQVVNLAGEPLPRALVERVYAQLGVQRVFNLYGPSEDTTYSTEALVARDSDAKPNIGRPLPGSVAYILDAAMQPVADGIAGELYLGGAGVTRGYFERPDLSAERYVPDPFARMPGARLYRCGDLVRATRDGELDFLGRLDHQVKLRGFRIELGEIEVALRRVAQVRDTVVIALDGGAGEARLVAYLVPHGEAQAALLQARASLRAQLPSHMVPGEWVLLAALPLTPNGKVDRQALPAPGPAPDAGGACQAPLTSLQELLAGIWKDVLHSGPLGIRDNFFDIGGHSLLAARILLRVQNMLGLSLPVRLLFEAPTIEALALAIEARKAQPRVLPPVAPVARSVAHPLSFAQQRQWMLGQFDAASGIYNVPLVLRLRGRLDVERLRGALNVLVTRHEPLRTAVDDAGGVPLQWVREATPVALGVTRLAPGPDGAACLALLLNELARAPFDLGAGALLRATLVQVDGEAPEAAPEHVLALVLHHMACDAWSLGLLTRELGELYAGAAHATPAALQYLDFAAWQRAWFDSGVLQPQLDYWAARLAAAPALLALPTDYTRPPVMSQDGASCRFVLNPELCASVEALARASHASTFMVLLAAFKLLLHRLSGSADVCVGIPVTDRLRPEFESLLGCFGNTLVIRDTLAADATFAGFLAQVKASCLQAYDNQDVPFERVLDYVKAERRVDAAPLFQAMLVLESGAEAPRFAAPGLQVEPVALANTYAKFDLTLAVREEAGGLACALVYSSALFAPASVQRMADNFQCLLQGALDAPQRRVHELAWPSKPERDTILQRFSAPVRAHPAEGTLHGHFEQAALARPDAVAVADQDGQISYAELNRRANQLAHHLGGHGVRPGARIALCAPRGIALLVGVLGILKAGAAYVPIDPDYPADRIDYIRRDAGCALVVTSAQLALTLPHGGVPLVLLDQLDYAATPGHNPTLAVSGAAPAYVIYTSGSTGHPKGVLIAHHCVLRLFGATDALYGFGARDIWTLFHSSAFDFSVWEIWGALLKGARLLVVPFFVSRAPDALHRMLAEQRVTVLNQTPSAFGQLIEAARAAPPGAALDLEWVIFGGEALEPGMLGAWFERHPHTPRLVNMYGITETTVHVTHREITAASAMPGTRSIGRPIDDLGLYILDPGANPAPIGVTGEMYVAGPGLASGYLNRPELTAERFVPDPFSGVPGARLYRSGDLGRFDARGSIDYLGRIDHQVKIRGHRIELGEISAALCAHAQVAEALADVYTDDSGAQAIVAYVVAAPQGAPDGAALRSHLAQLLPSYMVPATFGFLDAIPLTANGKVDRKALPAPVRSTRALPASAPEGPTETALAAIWSEVLGVTPVGRTDNFFELGGHSLSATQIIFQIRSKLGLQTSLQMLFKYPDLALLAQQIDQAGPAQAAPAALAPIRARRR